VKKSFKEKSALVLILASLYSATAGVFYLAVTRTYQPDASFDVIRLLMLVLLFPLIAKYVLQLVCSPLYSLVDAFRKQSNMAAWTPSVSVLIPAWNEEVGIVKTIKSVLHTQYPRLQIVVINDGSTDGTHEKVTGFMADHKPEERYGARLEYLNVSNGGKARAMNRGFLEADGEIIITIDADSIMDPSAIANLVSGVFPNMIMENLAI
jgi:biofilm PGA synthesis N-glycosyltransferase PgaC